MHSDTSATAPAMMQRVSLSSLEMGSCLPSAQRRPVSRWSIQHLPSREGLVGGTPQRFRKHVQRHTAIRNQTGPIPLSHTSIPYQSKKNQKGPNTSIIPVNSKHCTSCAASVSELVPRRRRTRHQQAHGARRARPGVHPCFLASQATPTRCSCSDCPSEA